MLKVDNPTIRILLVDGHAMVREGVRLILESKFEFSVVGDTGDGKDAIEIARLEQPDIILIDPTPICDERYALFAGLLGVANNTRIILLTIVPDFLTMEITLPPSRYGQNQQQTLYGQAISHGAMGLVSKKETSDVLIKAIERVNAGEIWLEGSIATRTIVELLANRKNVDAVAANIARLTHREREVAALVAKALKNKQIAQRLFISEATVSHHLTSIFNKLGISNRSQLIIYALSHRLN